mgnify:CR=1 FL=1
MEEWKTIPWANKYQVSNYGNIRHVYKKAKPHLLTPSIKPTGYLEIGLKTNDGKRKWALVHRLVLSVFNPIENYDKFEVNHKDENKMNNNLSNLEWMTSKENCNYGKRNEKISKNHSTKRKVRCIETNMIFDSIHDAARAMNLNVTSIYNACRRYERNTFISRRNTGLHWRFE